MSRKSPIKNPMVTEWNLEFREPDPKASDSTPAELSDEIDWRECDLSQLAPKKNNYSDYWASQRAITEVRGNNLADIGFAVVMFLVLFAVFGTIAVSAISTESKAPITVSPGSSGNYVKSGKPDDMPQGQWEYWNRRFRSEVPRLSKSEREKAVTISWEEAKRRSAAKP